MSLRMFEAVPHVLCYLAEPGSTAHLSLRVRLGRLCHQAQAVWRGDGCRAERDEVERQEDELQAQLDREAEEAEEEERWWRMGMVCDALFERWGEDD
jgi:hypothetical protein